ncbi:MAG: hypothetical protein QOK37_4404 [Thermoanaerobaculia bacterium]|jgi:hypothetical protein|nr:hypothetical protein [Thermoanaerobaculia bacterium]
MLWLAATLFAAATALHRPQPEVLFAIRDDSQDREGSPDNLAIEPIAMITKRPGSCPGCWKLTFAQPPEDHDDEFEARYFQRGRTYRMLAGGAEIGTVKVVKTTDLGCVSLAASVDVMPARSKRDWNRLRLLAVGSLHVPPAKEVRREPDEAEDSALWKVAEQTLRAKGVPASLFAKMEGGAMLATDLDHDGRRDLIGSFQIYDAATQRTHSLFLIAMGKEGGGVRAEHVWYFTYVGDKGESKHLVDTIDLDEDGTDEIVVSWGFYESNEYEILKRAGNKWKSVYRGGGSGC